LVTSGYFTCTAAGRFNNATARLAKVDLNRPEIARVTAGALGENRGVRSELIRREIADDLVNVRTAEPGARRVRLGRG
jgi:hypothetical protein